MSHDDIENTGSNPTDNPHIDEVVAAGLNRRQVMQGGLTALALGFFAGSTNLLGSGAALAHPPQQPPGQARKAALLGFQSVGVSDADTVVVPPGYKAEVLIPWGTPLFAGVEWKKDASNTAAEQEKQVGFNHDGMHYFPLVDGDAANRRGLLVLNHEYTDSSQIYTAAQGMEITPDDAEKVAKALAGHGVTVVEVQQGRNGRWSHVVGSPFNRRITGTTPVAFSGPVTSAHPELATNDPVARGTLNNCAHGYTPWGTYLACEENFNGYFGTDRTDFEPTPSEARYGIRRESGTRADGTPNPAAGTVQSFGYQWHRADPRFDLSVNRKELNRFGWVVEIDPARPGDAPVKRTALGRFKHESATVTEGTSGQVVVYSGDDENLDYVYKFVGSAPWKDVPAASRLDDGTLHVARFSSDGTGVWLPLVHGQAPLTTENGWVDQADVLLRTREAADALKATPLHRPEWVTVDERTKDVYLTLTNGSTPRNSAGEPSNGTAYTKAPQDGTTANPAVNADRDPNTYGHVLRWRETGGDNAALTFTWEVFLLAGDPTKAADATVPDEARFGSPDGIWADQDGRIWIQTDVSNGTQLRGAYDRTGNNSMLVADPETKEVKRFFVGPRGCEVTGVITTPDQRTMFVNIQHPGEETRAIGAPTTDDPRAVSNWPDFDPDGRPRSATVVIRKANGGVIGT